MINIVLKYKGQDVFLAYETRISAGELLYSEPVILEGSTHSSNSSSVR